MGDQLALCLAPHAPTAYVHTLDVRCPKCGRGPGEFCRAPWVTRDGVQSDPKSHRARKALSGWRGGAT